jgi:hypothetical protein
MIHLASPEVTGRRDPAPADAFDQTETVNALTCRSLGSVRAGGGHPLGRWLTGITLDVAGGYVMT